MEALQMEDLSYWDPTGDLQDIVDQYLPTVPDNWEHELGLGSYKGETIDVLEEGNLPKEQIFDIPDTMLDEWMESKMYLGSTPDLFPFFDNVDVLDSLDHQEQDKPKIHVDTDASLLPNEAPQDLTPPDSPSCISSPVSIVIDDGASTSSLADTYSLESITPPDSPSASSTDDSDGSSATAVSDASKPRSKPYSRRAKHSKKESYTVEPKTVVCSDKKKSRKRDQNRDAATRYRQKKKAEAELLTNVQSGLESKNKELKDKVDSLASEIGYLKGLLKEIVLAKSKSKLQVIYVKC